jgi:hypothetical protein
MMRKQQQQQYTCLTFFKQDIRELIQLFQNNFHDVEIVIDGASILDIAQLEQFEPNYQATSLTARGYGHEVGGEDTKRQGERLLVELNMDRVSAVLLVSQASSQAEPESLVQIKKLLLRSLNRIHQFMIAGLNRVILWPSLFLLLLFLCQHLHVGDFIVQVLLAFATGFSLLLLALFLQSLLVLHLKMETTIFLLPGASRDTQIYGRREAVGRLIIALITLIVCDGSLIFALKFVV